MRIYSIAGTLGADPGEHVDGNIYMGISLADALVDVRRYGPRTWAVYFGGKLICVTVYLKGAVAVQNMIEQFQAEIQRAKRKRIVLPLASDPQTAYGDHLGTAS